MSEVDIKIQDAINKRLTEIVKFLKDKYEEAHRLRLAINIATAHSNANLENLMIVLKNHIQIGISLLNKRNCLIEEKENLQKKCRIARKTDLDEGKGLDEKLKKLSDGVSNFETGNNQPEKRNDEDAIQIMASGAKRLEEITRQLANHLSSTTTQSESTDLWDFLKATFGPSTSNVHSTESASRPQESQQLAQATGHQQPSSHAEETQIKYIRYLNMEEMNSLPKYFKWKKVTLEDINTHIDLFNNVLAKKYAILQKKDVKRREMFMHWQWKREQQKHNLTDEMYFTLEDVENLGFECVEKTTEKVLVVLRNTKRLDMKLGGRFPFYVVVKNEI